MMSSLPHPPVSSLKPHIDAILPLSTIRDEGKNELLEILMTLRGRKCLVLEPHIGGLLNLIIPEGSLI